MIIALWFDKFQKMSKDDILKKIIKNSGIVFFGNSSASALSFISLAIMAKQLGPEALGMIVLAQTYAIVVNDIFNVQTWESLIKFGSSREHKSETAMVIKSNVMLDVASAAVATAFAVIMAFPAGKLFQWEHDQTSLTMLYSLSILFNITTLTIGVPRFFDKFKFVAKNQIFFAGLKLVLISVVAYLQKPYSFYLLIYLIMDILANLSLIRYSTQLIHGIDRKWWRGWVRFNREQLRYIWWINLRTIVRIPVRRLDVMIINLVISVKMVGIYKVYKEIAGILDRLSDPISQAIFPEFTKLIGANEINQSRDIAKKVIGLLFVVSLILTAVMILVAKPVVSLFFGAEYMTHISVLYALVLFYWIVFFTTPINSLFLAAGFAKYSFYLVLFSNAVFLLVAYSLGKLIGIYAIVTAFIIQGILNQSIKIYLMRKFSSDWNVIIR